MSEPRLPVFDFPERLGAITVRELRAGLLGRDLVYLLIGVQLALALAGVYAVEIASAEPQSANSLMQASVWAAAIVGLGLLFPLRALRALHSDRDSGLLELQQLTPLSSGGIVLGKFTSLALQSLLYLVTLLPFFALRYFLGGADLVGDAITLLLMFGGSLLLQSLCFLLSTVPKLIRGLALVGLIVSALFLTIQVMLMSGRFGFGVPSRGNNAWALLALFGWMQVFVAYFLAVAAQAIAAPAENYVARARLALLAGIGWFAGMVAVGNRMSPGRPTRNDLTGFLAVVFVVVAVMAFVELTSEARLLDAQLPRRLRRWPGLRGLSLLLLPGWQSALAFYGGLLGALYVVGILLEVHWLLLVLVPQGVAVVVLPRLVLETLGRAWRSRGIIPQLLLQVGFALIPALVAAVYALRAEAPAWANWLPVTGFWNRLAWHGEVSDKANLAGFVWLSLVFGVLAARARPRWKETLRLARRRGTG